MRVIASIITAVVVYFFYKFFLALYQDKKDLKENPIEERFSHLIYILGHSFFEHRCSSEKINSNSINIFNPEVFYVVNLNYAVETIVITWMNKYDKRDRYEKTFYNTKNLSDNEQILMAVNFFNEVCDVKNIPT
jgi:hypothetical protein